MVNVDSENPWKGSIPLLTSRKMEHNTDFDPGLREINIYSFILNLRGTSMFTSTNNWSKYPCYDINFCLAIIHLRVQVRDHRRSTAAPFLCLQLVHSLPQLVDERLLFLLQSVLQLYLLPSKVVETILLRRRLRL